MNEVIMIALISALPGLLALIIQFRKARTEEKVSGSEITERITGAASLLMEKMQSQIDRLETEIKCLELKIEVNNEEILKLKKGINKLVAQIRHMGAEPVWTPENE